MKVMILSDSHSMPQSDLFALLKANPVDYYIHCGDIYMTYEGLNLNNFYLARGNNDFYQKIPKELLITIDGLKFFITHGHLYDVDYNLDTLTSIAKEKQADVVCFGHTHQPTLQTQDKIIIINPGSVTYPRGKFRQPTFCIFDTQSKVATFYNATTNEVCEPFFKEIKVQKTVQKKEPFFKKWFQ